MSTQTATRGQIERSISQQIQALYRTQLGHQPGKVTCQLFDEKLAIVIENSLTQPEQLLAEQGQIELVAKVRTDLDGLLRPHLRSLIEETLGINVMDLLSDATLETGRTGIIVVLNEVPQFREAVNRKVNKKRLAQAEEQE